MCKVKNAPKVTKIIPMIDTNITIFRCGVNPFLRFSFKLCPSNKNVTFLFDGEKFQLKTH